MIHVSIKFEDLKYFSWNGLEQLVHFPTREKNTLDLILTSLPGQFQEIHSPDKLSDHDVISGTLKIHIPPKKKPRRKVFLYQKGNFELMRKDASDFAKDKYTSVVTQTIARFRKTLI